MRGESGKWAWAEKKYMEGGHGEICRKGYIAILKVNVKVNFLFSKVLIFHFKTDLIQTKKRAKMGVINYY